MLFSLILLFSCAGVPRYSEAPSTLTEVTLDSIKDAITEGAYRRAFFYLQILENQRGGDQKEIAELRAASLEKMEERYQELLKQEEFVKAESMARSLRAVGAPAGAVLPNKEPSYQEPSSKEDEILAWSVPQLYKMAMEVKSIKSREALQQLYEAARDAGLRTVARAFFGEMENRSYPLSTEMKEWVSTSVKKPADNLEAVVTVWVNRGMRIEGGVGLPDRVIGSGFFIDKEGYLVTNYHVISSEVDPSYEGFSRLYIKLSEDSDTRIPARVVGYSEIFDIALLKVERGTESILSFNLAPELTVGESIYALGSPGGLENTLTSGIISSTGRKILQMGNVVQVDVPINQGNSGGPLLNGDGELIGVVFAGIEQFEGINFAIPGQWVLKLLPYLYEGGAYPHAALGISLRKGEKGLEIIYLAPGSPAEKLDLLKDDVLLSLGGEDLKEIEDAHPTLLASLPGELLSSRWLRDGEVFSRTLLTVERKSDGLKEYAKIDNPIDLFPPLFGMEVVLTGEGLLKDRYRIDSVYPGSIADESGLSPGDPFTLERWTFIDEAPFVLARLRIKKRKAGFLESGIQLPGYLEPNNFL